MGGRHGHPAQAIYFPHAGNADLARLQRLSPTLRAAHTVESLLRPLRRTSIRSLWRAVTWLSAPRPCAWSGCLRALPQASVIVHDLKKGGFSFAWAQMSVPEGVLYDHAACVNERWALTYESVVNVTGPHS